MNNHQVQALLRDGSYQGRPLRGSLIETHISWVILTPHWAFKIKKPIQYPFLDFSTLEKRKHLCEREVTLNRRLTAIYLDVIPIREDGSLGPGTSGIVDYAVRMKRLQSAKRMDEMIRRGQIQVPHIHTLAHKIAHFHRGAEIITQPLDLAEMKRHLNGIFTILPWVKDHLDKKYVYMINHAVALSDSFLEASQRNMERRIADGFKRDVHGDLHSRNIFLYKDPVIFDCIEFNDAYRRIDVLSEVAFFCMDLEAFGRKELSREFMDQYLRLFPCIHTAEDNDLFRYFKFYRACVRAEVNGLRAMQATGEEAAGYASDVVKYLELMWTFADRLSMPT